MKLAELQKMNSNLTLEASQEEFQNAMLCLKEQGVDVSQFYKELEMVSPYVDTYQDASFSNTMQQLHSHTFYEILYCCNTCGAEYLIDSNRYHLQEGDIVMIPPGISHRSDIVNNTLHFFLKDV